MYQSFYGMRERPFELGPNLRFLYLPRSHQEALSNLHYGIASRKGLTVLTGEVGTGKTTLVSATIAQNAERGALCVHMSNPRLTDRQFFEFLANSFSLGLPPDASKVACLSALEAQLRERLHRGLYTTLIVDEAQGASDELIEEVRLLTNMQTSTVGLLSIILVGQPELADRLNTQALRQVKQRVSLRCTLRALTLHETAGYIASRIQVAGGAAADVFTREAVRSIYDASGGIPRLVSVLCDNALVTGFATNTRPVGSALVREVCQDFDLKWSAKEVETVRQSATSVGPVAADVLREVKSSSHQPETPDDSASELSAARPLFGSPVRRRRLGAV